MLGDSAVLGAAGGGGSSSGEAVPPASADAAAGAPPPPPPLEGSEPVVAGGSNNSGDDEIRGEGGDRSFGGNRWPRQETLALLKIRSDMDVAFRDASVKGPLWEEVSRKLAELGYHRNAKKCKEKFENVYKYHKRTKEGRSGKSDGKTYRFFDQLQALENNPAVQSPTPSSKPPQLTQTATTPTALNATPVSMVKTTTVPMPQIAANTTHSSVPLHASTVPSLPPISIPQPIPAPSYFLPNPTSTNNPPPQTTITTTPHSFTANIPNDLLSNSISTSSTSSDETLDGDGSGRNKRKRKWKDFFGRLMKEVVEKQEDLQRRFLEAIEKREHERAAREEAWRMQEMQRINREREILAQERSIAAAKDAAVMSFLQKIAEQQNLGGPPLNNISTNIPMPPTPTPIPIPTTTPIMQHPPPATQIVSVGPTHVASIPQNQPSQQQQQPQQVQPQQQQVTNMEIVLKVDDNNGGGENVGVPAASSSRWPKAEVQALINLRTSLDAKYQENGPKGPLWEEISSLMKKHGYNRSAKRCKEKWENINKYFKKVKESNKKRPEDSKTCPYFHQLDALYRERNKFEKPPDSTMMAPLMVRPEQQWPPQEETHQASTATAAATVAHSGPEVTMEEAENVNPMGQRNHEEDEDDDEEDDKEIGDEEEEDEDEDDDDDEGGGNNYEIVASKRGSVGASAE